jgi:dihydroflavonol-4-reductase
MSIIVVTGAAGHVGANLVRELLARGQRVRALVHDDRRALEGLDVETVPADVENLDSLLHAFDGAEQVVHAAGYISISSDEWPRLEAVNVHGTRNVVDACLRCGVERLIHVSSVETLLEKPFGELVDESRPLVDSQHCSPYARSKAAGEREVRKGLARGLDAVILYPSAIIGPHDYRLGFPNNGLLAICRGELWALVDGGFDWVDVRDVVSGTLEAAVRAPTGGRYILSGHWASLQELAELAAEINGSRASQLVFPMWLARAGVPLTVAFNRMVGKRPLYTSAALRPLWGNHRLCHARATRELGYDPRPLKETIVETLQWFERPSRVE